MPHEDIEKKLQRERKNNWQRKWRAANPEKNKVRQRSWILKNPKKKMLSAAHIRAKEKGLEFSISV